MDKSQLVTLLCQLNNNSVVEYDGDFEEYFTNQFNTITTKIECDFDTILGKIPRISELFTSLNISSEWKYICLNFYLLELLNDALNESEDLVLSVQETKNLKISLRNILIVGILKNIHPKLPNHVPLKTSEYQKDIFYTYNLLKCTVSGFGIVLNYQKLRMLFLPEFLQAILVATFQMAYCKIKKPSIDSEDNFTMTEELYEQLLREQDVFKESLQTMQKTIFPTIFVKEIMILYQANAPLWFKSAIAKTLTAIMCSPKGLEHIALILLDGSENDTTKTWKIVDILTKIILTYRKSNGFLDNICPQVLDLLVSAKRNENLRVFERLVIACATCFYEVDKNGKNMFLERMLLFFSFFTSKTHKFVDGEDVTDDMRQAVRLLHGGFINNAPDSPCLPLELLGSAMNAIFRFHNLTVKSTALATTSKELEEILIKCLQSCPAREIDKLFDAFFFGFDTDMPSFRDDVMVHIDERVIITNCQHKVIFPMSHSTHTLLKIMDKNQKMTLFSYLLTCIVNKDRYFSDYSNPELLRLEGEGEVNYLMDRLLTTHQLLSELTENKNVQAAIREEPDHIIEYIQEVLLQTIQKSGHSQEESLFTIILVLEVLVSTASASTLPKYNVLTTSIRKISQKTKNSELKTSCGKIIDQITAGKVKEPKTETPKTEFDKALEDISDPLLPVRGHGLLILTKLIEKKDFNAMERKQFLLNLFQLSLKDEDSFIYLNAVQGLAALADTFTDTVLEVLCEEFSDFTKKNGEDGHEIRIKLGEVLVRITKMLGEMAPKYKSLLLNTFLSGTKDEDHLVRASSLSNLGEVCRVLGFKLGTIVTEVLMCVHCIITTDKSEEARRAAVTVIRQLFVGLENETVAFLKDEILPVYRTLKQIYNHDPDDVMRLQAQLALEELNKNMTDFVFPQQKLQSHKGIILLD